MADRWARAELCARAHRILYVKDGVAHTWCGLPADGIPEYRIRITSTTNRIDQCHRCNAVADSSVGIELLEEE